MINNHDIMNRISVSLMHLKGALDKAKAYSDTPLGSDLVSDIMAAKSNLLFIGNSIRPEDLLDKV